MRQYCPMCKQMYESDTRFCPKCDVVMYKEEAYLSCLKNNIKMNITTHKRIDAMKPLGKSLAIAGAIIFFLSLIFISLGDDIIVTISAIGIIVGTIAFIVGMCFIGNNRTYTQKETNSNGNKTSSNYIDNLLSQPTIECPYCHSVNVTKIDALNRTGSILLFGLASGKIGKQWHCNNCKSDF